MKKQKPSESPIIRPVNDRYSDSIEPFKNLNFGDWFTDDTLLRSGDGTRHRVYPIRVPPSRVVRRVCMQGGVLCWVLDLKRKGKR